MKDVLKVNRIFKLKLIGDATELDVIGRNYLAAINWMSEIIFKRGKPGTSLKLHKEFYGAVRAKFNTPSQVTCGLFRHVVATYKMMKTKGRWEQIVFYNTIIPMCANRDFVNYENSWGRKHEKTTDRKPRYGNFPFRIWNMPFTYQSRPLPAGPWKDSRLKLVGKQWYLLLTIELDVPELKQKGTIVGVDSGIKNLFVAVEPKSNRTLYINSGALNHRKACLRRRIMEITKVGTRSSRRLLRRNHGLAAAISHDFVHVASKKLVAFAKSVDARAIVVENLTGIKDSSIKCNKRHRGRVQGWPFAKGQFCTQYKAANEGIAFEKIYAAYTSQDCPRCGCSEPANRKGLVFLCVSCGHQDNADRNAGVNIAFRSILHRLADGGRALIGGLIVADTGGASDPITNSAIV